MRTRVGARVCCAPRTRVRRASSAIGWATPGNQGPVAPCWGSWGRAQGAGEVRGALRHPSRVKAGAQVCTSKWRACCVECMAFDRARGGQTHGQHFSSTAKQPQAARAKPAQEARTQGQADASSAQAAFAARTAAGAPHSGWCHGLVLVDPACATRRCTEEGRASFCISVGPMHGLCLACASSAARACAHAAATRWPLLHSLRTRNSRQGGLPRSRPAWAGVGAPVFAAGAFQRARWTARVLAPRSREAAAAPPPPPGAGQSPRGSRRRGGARTQVGAVRGACARCASRCLRPPARRAAAAAPTDSTFQQQVAGAVVVPTPTARSPLSAPAGQLRPAVAARRPSGRPAAPSGGAQR